MPLDRSPDACLYCGETKYRPLYQGVQDRLKHVPGQWSFLECEHCRSAVLEPFPETHQIGSFYPPVYDFSFQSPSALGRFLRKMEYLFFFKPLYQSQCRSLLKYLGIRRSEGGRLLDAGCGRGVRLDLFRSMGFNVSGSDLNAASAEYVQKTLNIPAVECGIEKLGDHLGPESMDVVTSFYVIEHVPSVSASLKSFRKLLKPGGTLVLATLLNESFQSKVWGDRWAGVTEAPRHLTIPSEQGLRAALEAERFSDIQVLPDSLWSCLGVWILSLFPSLGRRHSGKGAVAGLIVSLGAVLAAVPLIPWCWIENQVLKKPALVLLFAKKSAS